MNDHIITTVALVKFAPRFIEETKHKGPEQVSARPNIDDVICHILEGNALKDALAFIDNIRANRMKIRWSSVNVWSVSYKRRHVCDIRLEKGSWSVSQISENINTREAYFPYNSERMIWLIRAQKDSVSEDQQLLKVS